MRRVGESRVFQHVAQPDGVDFGDEQPLHEVGELQPAPVFGANGEILYWRGAGRYHGRVVEVFGELDHHLPDEPLHQVVVRDRAEDAGFDSLAAPGSVADGERRRRAANRRHRRRVAADLHRAVVGALAVVLSGERHVAPALGAHDRLVRAIARVRTIRAERGYGYVHQARVFGA